MSGASHVDRRIADLSPARREYLSRLLQQRSGSAGQSGAAGGPALVTRHHAPGTPLPCSFAQERLWFLDRLEPDNPAYVIVTAPRLPGQLDLHALERSLAEIVRRHEMLRTTFVDVDGRPAQVIAAHGTLPFTVVDVSTEADPTAALARLALAESRRTFDLACGPLMRATLVRVAGDLHVLLLALHHIVTDGWSMGVLFDELAAIYGAFASGRESPLPPLTMQYSDFAAWQRERLSGGVATAQLAYWRERLRDLPRLELPSDRPRPMVKSTRGASVPWQLSSSLTSRLTQLAHEEGVTMFMLLFAGVAALLSRYTGQTDLAIGSPIANRTHAQIEPLIGCFVNTLVLRVSLDGDPSFRALLGRVRDAALGGYAHQDLPFEQLVDALQPQRDLSRNPLFEVMLQLQSRSRTSSAAASETRNEAPTAAMLVTRDSSVFDLSIDVWEGGAQLVGQMEYSTDLFDRATIVRMTGHLVTLLEAAVDDPQATVATMPLLTAEERKQLLQGDGSAGSPGEAAAALPAACLHELFQAQVARTPEAAAVAAGDGTLTYAGLNARANRVARLLQARGCGPGTIVAVQLSRGVDLIVSLLGVLKSGAAYLPLDPALPAARVDALVKDARASWFVNLLLEEERDRLASMSSENPDIAVSPDDLAYVTYTSGSTGAPKGVEITHGALINHATAMARVFELGPGECVLQLASIGFDVSAEEIFPALISGAAIAPAWHATQEAPEVFLSQIAVEHITVVNLPTPLWQAWIPMLTAAPLPDCLRLVVIGSDRLGEGTLEQWRSAMRARDGRSVRLMHAYGVTEATITSLVHRIDEYGDDSPEPRVRGWAEAPIGRPITNTEAYVLDAHRQLVPLGAPGELYLGGAGLARGYRGRPDLTAERFLPHPFRIDARVYRTGDRVRMRGDGAIEFLGRFDDQIKLHGFRIEPREIEAALLLHTLVASAYVIARELAPGDRRLVAYLVAHRGPADAASGMNGASNDATVVAPDVLTSFLRERLPASMIPAAYVWLSRLPLTPQGKLDRKALPAPDAARPALLTSFVAARTTIERAIARAWCDVLHIDAVGRDDNFFDLGGRSLLLVRVHQALRPLAGEALSILDLFRYPTVSTLAAHLERPRSAATSEGV